MDKNVPNVTVTIVSEAQNADILVFPTVPKAATNCLKLTVFPPGGAYE